MREELSRVTFLFVGVEDTSEETLKCLVVKENILCVRHIKDVLAKRN